MSDQPNRRTALATLSSLLLAAALPRSARAALSRRGGPHPVPRPGIDAAHVLPDSALADWPDALPAFAAAREIPAVLDGIRCNCGCAGQPGFYSLLSCYEADGMARHCAICQGQAKLAFRLHRSGKSLDEIRAAIDARYG